MGLKLSRYPWKSRPQVHVATTPDKTFEAVASIFCNFRTILPSLNRKSKTPTPISIQSCLGLKTNVYNSRVILNNFGWGKEGGKQAFIWQWFLSLPLGWWEKIGTGFILFLSLQIPWLSMTFSMTFSSFQWPKVWLSLSKTFKTILALGQFLTWFIVRRITLWCPPKCVPFELLNYLSLYNFVLVFTSAVTNLTNTTSIFHDFPWPTIINFHDFQGLKNEILKYS